MYFYNHVTRYYGGNIVTNKASKKAMMNRIVDVVSEGDLYACCKISFAGYARISDSYSNCLFVAPPSLEIFVFSIFGRVKVFSVLGVGMPIRLILIAWCIVNLFQLSSARFFSTVVVLLVVSVVWPMILFLSCRRVAHTRKGEEGQLCWNRLVKCRERIDEELARLQGV